MRWERVAFAAEMRADPVWAPIATQWGEAMREADALALHDADARAFMSAVVLIIRAPKPSRSLNASIASAGYGSTRASGRAVPS